MDLPECAYADPLDPLNGAFAPGFLVVVEPRPSGAAVRLAGELDLEGAAELGASVPRLPWGDDVEIDLRAVRFLDSTGLAALVDLHEVLTGRGCAVRLVGPRGGVLRLLDLASGAGWLPLPLPLPVHRPDRPDWALVPQQTGVT